MFYNKLKSDGRILLEASQQMFFASVRSNKWNYSFSFSDKAWLNGQVDRELIAFIRDGTLASIGKSKNFGDATFNFLYYREVSVGISKKHWDNLDIGFRGKLLFGKFWLDAQKLNVSVETNNQKDALTVNTQGAATLVGPFKINKMFWFNQTNFTSDIGPGDYFLNLRNLGFAADFGLIYRPDRKNEIALSITDLGFIGFKHHKFDIDFIHPIVYTENTLYQSVDPRGARYIEPREALLALGDSLAFVIEAKNSTLRNSVFIPAKICLSARYIYSSKIQLGGYARVEYRFPGLRNCVSGFATRYFLKNKLGVTGTLGLYDFRKVLPGIGACYATDKIQFFILTNNIQTIVQPIAAKHLTLSLGFNMLLTTKN
jgi:hypothetical protein